MSLCKIGFTCIVAEQLNLPFVHIQANARKRLNIVGNNIDALSLFLGLLVFLRHTLHKTLPQIIVCLYILNMLVIKLNRNSLDRNNTMKNAGTSPEVKGFTLIRGTRSRPSYIEHSFVFFR